MSLTGRLESQYPRNRSSNQHRIDKPPSFTGGGIKHLWTSFDGKYAEALTYLTVEDDGTVVCYWNDGFPELEKSSTVRLERPNAIRREASSHPSVLSWSSTSCYGPRKTIMRNTPTSKLPNESYSVLQSGLEKTGMVEEIHGGGGDVCIQMESLTSIESCSTSFALQTCKGFSEVSIAQELNE